ncbi:beta-L-arabinofuranosidase domain-containing protein [Pedobacter sp. MW01-1-1]|uniref:beta-L-arabinofuranosidase domain-containing protein n=1 Tax=Pedobacter sp. MW01-1-1 TaxID=3383027 RepID=UPI003FEE2484
MKKIVFIFFFAVSFACVAQESLKTFPLSAVKLLDEPFKQAQETDLNYILSLDPDRLLAPYLKESGLTPKAESYGNWENTGLDGHIGGHYLSALSMMYAATHDKTVKERIDYVIRELNACQQKNGNGYLSGIPKGKVMWAEIKAGNIRAASFSLNGRWVPLYNIHKIYAGLYDAYFFAGNTQAKGMLIALTDWCIDLVSGLRDAQVQEMLKSEHGGLNEIFAKVYDLTGNKKYLKLAIQFSDLALLNPLLKGKDALTGIHANTQIPKVIGFEQIALLNGDKKWSEASAFFWNTVVEHRSIAIGGNSVREHFNPTNDFSSMIESREGPETCNSYNMLKLSEQLFLSSTLAKYMDYYEETVYNHILSTQRPAGGFVYFTPIRPGHYRTYSSPQESFWCCVGSGLENHAKYGEIIYAHTASDLFVNLFIASELAWEEKGLHITQEVDLAKNDVAKFRLKLKKSARFGIRFRAPYWVKEGATQVSINGKKVTVTKDANGYFGINRLWQSNDLIEVKMPMHVETVFLPDGSDWLAFKRGPFVLAAALDTLSQPNLTADGSRMGHIASGPLLPLSDAPFIIGEKKELADGLIKEKNQPMTFSAANLIYQPAYKKLKLVPFYTLHDERYVLYWPFVAKNELDKKLADMLVSERVKVDLEQHTIDLVNTGEQQPESDHGFKGEKTTNGLFQERHYRNATAWFSYQLRDPKLVATKVRLTVYGKERNKAFSVYFNDQLLENLKLDGTKGDGFVAVDVAIPATLRKASFELKFVADAGSAVANIYEVRLMK